MIPILTSQRLTLDGFTDADAPALALILAEPEVTRNITADGSTPERCLESAVARIGWHNGAWGKLGYGVWAVRAGGALIGWCGFAEPDIGTDPEILYGLAPDHWGHGLASEAARAATDWLFAETDQGGVSAIIFARLNPASVAIAKRFGMHRRGTMGMADFMSSDSLAREVLDYEIWRLAHGRARAPEDVLFQAPYKGGQFASLGFELAEAVERAFQQAARTRDDLSSVAPDTLDQRVSKAFAQGLAEPHLDWYNVTRRNWLAER